MSAETRRKIVNGIVFWAQCIVIAGVIISTVGAMAGWWR